jgi:hypothetical protein
MKSNAQIVDGGGWLIRPSMGRAHARFFGSLSLLWLSVSIPASFPFWNGWPPSFGYLEWLCGAVVVAQTVFFVLAVVFLLRENPRHIIEHVSNPDHDIRKLY